MSDGVKGFLTIAICAVGVGVTVMLVDLLIGQPIGVGIALLVGNILGFLYGLAAGVLLSYDLNVGVGWLELIVDLTWSLLNTLFGLIIGIPLYFIFGTPSRTASEKKGWISFEPRSKDPNAFGNSVLQTLGTVNLGGPGQHELMHVLQARIFGPLYLPLFAVNYIVTTLIQLIWTATIGLVLWLTKVRPKPYFEAPQVSAVSGFWGWIYHSTFFELWAYAAGNP